MRAAASALPSVPMMMTAGSPGSTRTTDEDEERDEEEGGHQRGHPPRDVPPHYRATPRRYFCQATSDRSNTGRGRSFQMPVRPFLVDDEARVHVEPHRGRLVGEHLLHLHVELAALLVVHRDLRFREELLELGAVPAEVVLRVGEVADVPRLGVADDRHVVVGVLARGEAEHLRQPLPPLDLLDLGPDARPWRAG